MSVELPEGFVWVEVTSHRGRERLSTFVQGGLGASYGVWPESGGWPRGEYYMLNRRWTDAIEKLGAGVKVRKVAPRGKIFQRWSA